MSWTPAEYVKVIEPDIEELNHLYKGIRYGLATGSDMRYDVGQFLQYAGKLQDNAKLLHHALVREQAEKDQLQLPLHAKA